MRDEDDAASRVGQFPNAGEDALNLPLAESRRRLVEDQDACVAAERARDLHQLALGHGEILHHGVGPHIVEAKSRQQALDLAPIVCARERKLAPTRPSRMFSSTVSAGTRLSSCSTTAMPAACACRAFVSVTGVPSIRISP